MIEDKVCIIGAGPSGIAACKVFKNAGIKFDCFEKGSKIGGNWRYDNDNGLSSIYQSLHINTSKKMTAFSDFPMPDSYPIYPSHEQILHYLEEYVTHFQLKDNIIFNTSIIEVESNSDAYYQVKTNRGEIFQYKYIIVATGHHWCPRYPEPDFKGKFEGEIIHSHFYRTPDILKNKKVLIVGIGNSAVDIACEAARLNKGKVILSTRNSAHIFPHYIFGKPIGEIGGNSPNWMPLIIKRLITRILLWISRGSQEFFGIPKPRAKLLSEHSTVSSEIFNLAGKGLIKFKPNILEFRGKEVFFEDNTKENVDVIIYCTGYKIAFPFFSNDFLNTNKIEETNEFDLYKRIYHPAYSNLFFLGFVQPSGSIFKMSEIQAEWIAGVILCRIKLPTKSKMNQEIVKYKESIKRRFIQSKRHTIQVDFKAYKNTLEKDLNKFLV